MAEAVFAHMVSERGLADKFFIDSVGTERYHVGDNPDRRTVLACKKHNVKVSHKGQVLRSEHFLKFDYILCMDRDNLSEVKHRGPKGKHRAKWELFGSYSPNADDLIVDDPYYGGMDGFETMFDQITRCSEGLLERLQAEL
ncbi:Low molecular weight phosphotyrosine protein phosphatase [Coemansia thaxteri]|nr:Low molecular weight phosphotyrosine protein phosphatase [Coemansia thaxteri]